MESCTHVDQVLITEPSRRVCDDCLQAGDRWIHLRMCLTCGYVGCCDRSKGHHATKHFQATGHPLIRSIEPGESWAWCYADAAFLDDLL